nr:MAG TPA: hypothetical protein [Caudoviricetes sp.]
MIHSYLCVTDRCNRQVAIVNIFSRILPKT